METGNTSSRRVKMAKYMVDAYGKLSFVSYIKSR